MKKEPPRLADRTDVVAVQNPKLANALMRCMKQNAERKPAVQRSHRHRHGPLSCAADEARLLVRKTLVEGRNSDPNGYERIIGESDLTSINFLDRGRRAAAAVCRIKMPMNEDFAYGTGFLVGPRLLVTNHHVIANRAEASQVEAEFGYEHDVDGVLLAPIQFNLRPDEIFFTDSALDITFVAVAPFSEGGVSLERFGRLPLLPVSGKGVGGEWVSIIQHPNGQPKQIAIRASQIITLDASVVPGVNLEQFIHYSTDTEPGSSGSAVLNDQWQVVAIHHKAVAAPQQVQSKQALKRQNEAPAEPQWIANQGVRVSAIYAHLSRIRFEDDHANEILNRLSAALGFPPSVDSVSTVVEQATEQYAAFPVKRWKETGLGYDAGFLSHEISLDKICARVRAKGKTAPLLHQQGDELTYQHFSVVLHKKRKFALVTAVNIDGEKLIHPGKRKDTWRPDARIAREYQPDDELYVRTKKKEKVYFSRGHLVRLLDPCWGDTKADSKRGQEDTFHFTNAAPQFQKYNDSDWGNLEDYLLDKAQGSEKKLTVFTGPIFLPDDPFYGRERKGGPWQIPLSFWKVAVLQKSANKIAVAAFIVGQTEYVQALYEAKVFTGLRPYTLDDMRSRRIQTTVAAIEEQTELDFSVLRPFDAHGSLESTRQTRWINTLEDVQI
ncbi:MAG: DNA/RNA non-specific endonuclease [Limisphaerales bacterium]